MASDKRVGFIGAGQMAEALARGFIGRGIVKAENVVCTDPVAKRRSVFESFNTASVESNTEVREGGREYEGSGRVDPKQEGTLGLVRLARADGPDRGTKLAPGVRRVVRACTLFHSAVWRSKMIE